MSGGPLLLVAGLARCGSTLMMSMLDAGGFPIVPGATAVGYEHPANAGRKPLPFDAVGAIKWLDPQRSAPPPGARVRGSLLLLRDHREQARSHLKFLSAVGMDTRGIRPRDYAAGFKRDEPRAREVLIARGPVLQLRFEDIVEQPRLVLVAVQGWLGVPLDIDAAVEVLRPRETGARCLPRLLEFDLIDAKDPLSTRKDPKRNA